VIDDLARLRADFAQEMGRSLAMPIAGAAAWTIAGVSGLFLSQENATYVLLFATGAIFPLALLVGRQLNENILSRSNPLARLMGMSVLMVNLLWALHITLLVGDFEYFPLSIGIALGIHWIIFSWIKGHHVGLVHALLRTVLVTAMWWLVPGNRVSAVAVGVVIAYLYSITVMTRQPIARPLET
jgi:hypothetical protein